MLTQILVKPLRIMERQRLSITVRDEHIVGIIPGGRRLRIVLFFHGLAFQDQGSPLPDHLGHLETVQAGLLHHHRKSMNIKELRIWTWVNASDCPARSYA